MSWKSLSVDAKTRYVSGVTSFSGLDTSTQRFQVSQGRAIDLNNFIYKDGVIQKREGVEEIYDMENTCYIPVNFENPSFENKGFYNVNTINFNGIWSLTGEDNKQHIIAHIGKLLYEIKNIDTDDISIEPITQSIKTEVIDSHIVYYCYEFEDYKSSAFVGAKRLYFLGGNKFVCLKFILDGDGNTERTLYPIEDDKDTYIPTTTTSITYKNSAVSGRASLDNVNLMTEWRKNELLSGTIKSEDEKTQTNYYTYTLDAPLICKNESDMADIEIILQEGGIII